MQRGRSRNQTAASPAPKCRTQITQIRWIAQIEGRARRQDVGGLHCSVPEGIVPGFSRAVSGGQSLSLKM
jgi:hypothetical protein